MKKNKGHTREFRNDDPTTALSHIDQQKAMLLDTIEDAKQKPKKRVVEPIEIPEVLSVPRTQLTKKTEVIEGNRRPRISLGLSREFTQNKIREGQISKELDKEMSNERKKSEEKTNRRRYGYTL